MEAYIVKAYRSPIGKAKKGSFRNKRPDDLGAEVVRFLMKETPEIPLDHIDDLIVGNAMPEAEQGLNVGRIISLLGFDTVKIPGMTVNRYCASGLESIAIAASKIQAGYANCIIAGGVESMSAVPMGGWRLVPNPTIAKTHPDWNWNMGLTAEALHDNYKISREEQDKFSLDSHKKAVKAIKNGWFKNQIAPIKIDENRISNSGEINHVEKLIDTDEGAREDTTLDKLGLLKPVFAQNGTVTAGNTSQTSDGAAFLMVVSKEFLKKFNLTPIARFVAYATTGLEPKYMGIGPVTAIPKALKMAGLKQDQLDLIELNEAFAIQSLAVIKELKLNNKIVNVNGGAIALGHPLGCTGAKLSTQLLHELQRRKNKYGMVTMCVGSGQGAAGIFENLQ